MNKHRVRFQSVYRDAKTGRFLSAKKFKKRNPKTTIQQRIKIAY